MVYKTKWFVENDPYCQSVLKKRFAKAPIYADITQLDFHAVRKVDIITGGFPCQDVSNAGKRVGIQGSRSGLWSNYAQAIRILRPRYAFIENVPALTGLGLNVVLADLAAIGYDAEWHCVPASAIGADHKRDRIYVIAHTDSHGITKSVRQQKARRQKTQEPQTLGVFARHLRYGEGVAEFNVEPFLRRKDDGPANWVDRIRCLGNAVVPQVAEVFAQAIQIEENDRCSK